MARVTRRGPWHFTRAQKVGRPSSIVQEYSTRQGRGGARNLLSAAQTCPVEFRAPLVGLHVDPPIQKELYPFAL